MVALPGLTGTPEGVTMGRGVKTAHFMDAAVECGGATAEVCYDDPPQTGYEVVTALVNGKVQRDSVLVTVVPALKLTCSDARGVSDANGGATVVRAQSVHCKASLDPEGSTEALTVTDWHFVSPDGTLSRNRHDVNPTFSPDSTVWAGPMITSGTVTVTAAIGNSLPQGKSALITVRPRRWTKDSIPHFPLNPDSIGQGSLPTQPDSVHDLGAEEHRWRNNGVIDTVLYRGLVEDGPNAYVYFVKTMPPVLDSVRILINEAALKRGSPFYFAQQQDTPGVVYNASNPCYRSDVVSADTKDKILSHEGARWELNPVSHAGRMRLLAFERLPAAAESVYTKSEVGGRQGFMNRWHVLVYEGVEAKIDSLSNKPVDQENPVHFGSGSRFGCKFAFPSP